MSEATISVDDPQALLSLFGPRDQHLRRIREALDVRIAARSGQIVVEGAEQSVVKATEIFEQLKHFLATHGNLDFTEVERTLGNTLGHGPGGNPAADKGPLVELPVIDVFQPGRKVQPKTAGQARYIRTILDHDVVLAAGPAGTGKTYLAVAMAVAALKAERVKKIVLVRPAVEAGESLGYLPGDMQAKINPYLRPLLDALREMMDYEMLKRLTEQDVIEVVPLAYMRGRTLNDAFIILDEAQNATISQMKMFLTRMGRSSKIVVSGDMTQVDLPSHTQSGLIDAMRRLNGIEGLGVITLSGADIVRHRLVQEIVRAYDEGPAHKRQKH
ncbi:MAG: PhoH family protein [Planctomycetaceae bacterium]|nr:PhoH family protein [Planctomycetaceae bacterium]